MSRLRYLLSKDRNAFWSGPKVSVRFRTFVVRRSSEVSTARFSTWSSVMKTDGRRNVTVLKNAFYSRNF